MFKRLRTRLTAIFVVLAILPLSLASASTGLQFYNREIDQSIEKQVILNTRFSQAIEDIITERISELTFLGEVTGLDQLPLEEQGDLVSGLLVKNEAYNGISIVNPDGEERVRVARLGVVTDSDLISHDDDELFQEVLASGEVRLSDVYIDPQTGEPLLDIVVPLVNFRSGEISTILIGNFRFRIIWDLVASLQQDVDGDLEIFLVNASGLLVAHANPTIVLRGTTFEVPKENGQSTGLEEESAFVTSQALTIANQTFTIVGEQDTATVIRPALEVLVSTSLIAMTTLVVTVLVVAGVVRQIVRPIEQLSDTAQSIRDGNLEARTSIKRSDEIGVLANSFNEMTVRLQDLISNLENRVKERTRDLRVASEVSRQITQVLDLEQLLPRLTEQTRQGFNLYHVSVFLYNPETKTLHLAAGTGDAGIQMLQQSRQFPMDARGLVPLAANTQEYVLVNDVSQSANHSKNPMLPYTQSELAVPMLVGNKLIGVLDLQSQEVDHFAENDLQVMSGLAEQIAIAVQNAQQYQETEKARSEAERANSVKSQFLASVSHELRTPLNAILNFAKFVASGKMGEVNERQVNALTNVITSGNHLLSLINDVLDISKIEAGSLTLFVQNKVDLKKELQDIQATATALLQDKPVTWTMNIEESLPSITGDGQRIRQIVLNLVSNACKFTREGTINLSVTHNTDDVIIGVADTGPGIKSHEQEMIFEVFTQSESGLKSGQGTGLGLPISKRLAEAHGGKIWLDSRFGEGTTFWVSLPIQSPLQPTLKD